MVLGPKRLADGEQLPFTAHLEELRTRLIYSVITIAIAFGASFYFSAEIVSFLRKPLGDVSLVFISPMESFMVHLRVSLFTGLILSWPMLMYQAWMFVSPGLHRHERGYAAPFVILGTLFFLFGAGFCYLVVLPVGLAYLTAFHGEGITPMISLGPYVSFASQFMIAFGVVFEFPLVVTFLGLVNLLNADQLVRARKYSIVGAFVVAAVLTPTPDIFSQISMALPMILMYELSIIAVKIIEGRRRAARLREEAAETALEAGSSAVVGSDKAVSRPD